TAGDPAGTGAATGDRVLGASFSRPYLAHGSIGPSCAVAQWVDGHLSVWSATQGPYPHRSELARVFAIPVEDVDVTHVPGPGCYGHNGMDDASFEAALLARHADGRPVRLQWSRADEHAWEPFGPAAVVDVEATLDDAGRITSWRMDFFGNGHT